MTPSHTTSNSEQEDNAMSDVPEDVKAAAARIVGTSSNIHDERQLVIRGIMEERERAANAGYRICAETRHVTLGDRVAEAIRTPTP